MVYTRSITNNSEPFMSSNTLEPPIDDHHLTEQPMAPISTAKSQEQKRLETLKITIENNIKFTLATNLSKLKLETF